MYLDLKLLVQNIAIDSLGGSEPQGEPVSFCAASSTRALFHRHRARNNNAVATVTGLTVRPAHMPHALRRM
jgi:hypothetical protein